MKKYNKVELIILSKPYLKRLAKKELVKWFGTSLQPVVDRQERRVKKFFLSMLGNTPPIYLS